MSRKADKTATVRFVAQNAGGGAGAKYFALFSGHQHLLALENVPGNVAARGADRCL